MHKSQTLHETGEELARIAPDSIPKAQTAVKATAGAVVEAIPKATSKLAKAGGHLLTAAKRAGAAIPVAGIILGQASAAHAASTGDYPGAALDEIGFIPVVGDVIDAARAGGAVGEAISELLPDSVHMAIGGTIVHGLEFIGFHPMDW